MGEEYRARIFKSGNSLALRLPKALGLSEGAEVTLREEQGKYIFQPVDAPAKLIDISKFVGKAPWIEPSPGEDFDDPPRIWDDPDWPGFR